MFSLTEYNIVLDVETEDVFQRKPDGPTERDKEREERGREKKRGRVRKEKQKTN